MIKEEAPATSIGNASIDNTVTPKRLKKKPLKRFAEMYCASKYYQQPDGSWKQGGDGRSVGKTRGELAKMGVTVK